MKFLISKRCNMRLQCEVDRRSTHVSQVMTLKLQIQLVLDRLHFGEKLFTTIFSAKHVYYFRGVDDMVRE